VSKALGKGKTKNRGWGVKTSVKGESLLLHPGTGTSDRKSGRKRSPLAKESSDVVSSQLGGTAENFSLHGKMNHTRVRETNDFYRGGAGYQGTREEEGIILQLNSEGRHFSSGMGL